MMRGATAPNPWAPSSGTVLWAMAGLLIASGAAAAPHDLIICGSGGEKVFEERFVDWGKRLRAVSIDTLGHDEANVRLLTELPEGEGGPGPTSSLENIGRVLETLASTITNEDDLFIYLIGHGSYLRQISKFHIPGADLTSEALAEMIAPIDARRIIVVNAASSGAGFINDLSAEGRIVCSATKSSGERNATSFMEFFIQGLEEGSSDLNRDERISIFEASRQGAMLTQAWYSAEGLIPTEHALIDDNGDGLGTRLTELGAEEIKDAAPDPDSELDGPLAELCFLKDFAFPSWVPEALVQRYLTALDVVEQLKRNKAAMGAAQYYAELESLLLQAARANREIREMSDEGPSEDPSVAESAVSDR